MSESPSVARQPGPFSAEASGLRFPSMSESPSIAQLLDRFLSDQEDRLKIQQYRACSTVIDMLSGYLNRYAYITLIGAERQEWDRAFSAGDDRAFCNVF